MGIYSVGTSDEIEDKCADIIILTSVWEHVKNPLNELKKLCRILKENGRIVFHVPNESCDTEYQRSEVNNHLYTWNCLNIGNLFKAVGFLYIQWRRFRKFGRITMKKYQHKCHMNYLKIFV